jgi:hypothetical protein
LPVAHGLAKRRHGLEAIIGARGIPSGNFLQKRSHSTLRGAGCGAAQVVGAAQRFWPNELRSNFGQTNFAGILAKRTSSRCDAA